MMVMFWVTVILLVWLFGFSLLAEAWFYEEEQDLENSKFE